MDHSKAGKLGYEKTKDQLTRYVNRLSQAAREKYAAKPRYCLTCGELIPYEKRVNRFCDKSCSASYNNRGIVRVFKKKDSFCECGNPKNRRNKYCDTCIEKRVFNKHASLEQAKDDRSRKRILLEQREHRCAICGLSEWRAQPIALELDHVDGNADNNTEENLRLICPNCHAQTATYKGANAGAGSTRQAKRRQRYAQGKTY